MERLRQHEITDCIELGPGKVLSGLMRRISKGWTPPPLLLNVENRETLEKAKAALSGSF
jgi:malonyl CoA-acyl carrier protein transacylase